MSTQIQRLMFLLAIAGLLTVSADFACTGDYVCPTERSGQFHTMDEINQQRIETFTEAAQRTGMTLTDQQNKALARDGHLLGALAPLSRPVRHPDGTVEMPEGWLPELPEGHPWRSRLTPADDAFYSWFEERVLDARLFNPANPEHMADAEAYLAKGRTQSPQFVGWTFSSATECKKNKPDGGR